MTSSLPSTSTLTQDRKMTNPSYVSDELTDFLGRALLDDQRRYTLLREVVRTGWLKASHRDQLGPGFVGQSDGQKALSVNDAIKCTSVCFCDIPVKALAVHMKKYGPFGVAFAKQRLRSGRAQPRCITLRVMQGIAVSASAREPWATGLISYAKSCRTSRMT